jgi:ribosomal protein L9
MLWWAVLLVFGLPLINYLIQLFNERRATNKKLEKIHKRLKELEKKNTETSSD